ncbi:MAG: hypothetical protein AAGF99_00400 [Bacteroidota bacterium]
MHALKRAGERQTRAEIAEAVGVSYQQVSNVVDTLRGGGMREFVAGVLLDARHGPASGGRRHVTKRSKKTRKKPDRKLTEAEQALVHVNEELAAILRDRISGRRLEFRIQGLQTVIRNTLDP